ncbi:heterokaryon incompatibility protein-domain-containing protein [Xylariomycetidae sp. FL2044]|nr:heterokaryon incompatibility protein-domain-containing protein [Xylariomycetidae sp. FL2044]
MRFAIQSQPLCKIHCVTSSKALWSKPRSFAPKEMCFLRPSPRSPHLSTIRQSFQYRSDSSLTSALPLACQIRRYTSYGSRRTDLPIHRHISRLDAQQYNPWSDMALSFVFWAIVNGATLLLILGDTGNSDLLRFLRDVRRSVAAYTAIDPAQIMATAWLEKQGRLEAASSLGHLYGTLANDELRLLVLEGGKASSEVHCRLATCALDEELPYDAVSYTWGNSESRMRITCNGVSLGVPANLHEALLGLRRRTEDRIIWIDGLCINQQDLDERGQQVKKMAEIFSRARSTLVWLGWGDATAFEAFYLADRYHRDRISGGFFSAAVSGAPETIGFDFTESESKQDLLARDWRPMIALLERPWFTRLWVIQEVACARRVKVVCGNSEIDWERFAAPLIELRHKGLLDVAKFTAKAERGAHAVFEIQTSRERKQHGGQLNLLSLLLATNLAECRIAKDKVYAVLSLARDYAEDRDPDKFQPDYTITDAEAFTRVARWAVVVKGDLDLLLSCGTFDESRTLPSWVPDWTRIENHCPFLRYADRIPFNATKTPPQHHHHPRPPATPQIREDGSLILRGVAIDSIREIGPPSRFQKTFIPRPLAQHRQTMRDNTEWITGCLALVKALSRDETAGGDDDHGRWKRYVDMERRFRTTMTAGLTGDGDAAPPAFSAWFPEYTHWLHARYAEWIAHATAAAAAGEQQQQRRRRRKDYSSSGQQHPDDDGGRVAHALPPGLYGDAIAAIESSISMWASQRVFGVTRAGRLVLVPRGARKGDAVFLVEGCRVPFVFRRRTGKAGHGKEEEEEYSLIGEAFADDVMDGEFFGSLCAEYGGEELVGEFVVR